MTNENDLTDEEFEILKITDEEERGLILNWDKFKKIVALLDIPSQGRTNQHKRILRHHCFTLLFSSITYGENIVAKLDCPALIDIVDEKFGTPLIYALSIQQFGIAESLLEYTNQYINFVVRGNTALSYAALHSQTDLERKIMGKGGVVPGMKLTPGKTPSEVRNELITSFKKNKLRGDDANGDGSFKKFLSFCRVDDTKENIPFQSLDAVCLRDKSFYLLLGLVAYAHETRNTYIFFCDIEHRTNLVVGHDKTIAFVDYVSQNIFCFYDETLSIKNMAYLIHECTHLVINLIYDNYYQPYCTPEDESEFAKVIQLTQERLGQFEEHIRLNEPPESVATILAILNSVYKDYALRQWPEELIVRVPELLVMLGVQQGKSLLGEAFSELFDFYYQKVVPKMYDFMLSNVLKINLAGKGHSFLIIHEHIKRMLCDPVSAEECPHSLQEPIDELSLEEATQLREITLFLDYKTVIAVLNKHILKKEEQQQREERIETNISILNTLKLNPYPSACSDGYRYWAQFVEYGGFKRGEHRMPHTIAHIFDAIEALTPEQGAETRAPDCPPAALLETIHRASEEPSQSWASFFGHKNRAIEGLKKQVIQLKSHYQAPNH